MPLYSKPMKNPIIRHPIADRQYQTINALFRGETVELEGVKFAMDGDGEVFEGDIYIAERNTGPKLLTAKEVDYRGWIVPVEKAYPYDIIECVKVKLVE